MVSIKMLAGIACLIGLASVTRAQDSFFDIFYDVPEIRLNLPAEVELKASSANAKKIVKALETPCFQVERTNKGYRFLQAKKGFVAEKCDSQGKMNVKEQFLLLCVSSLSVADRVPHRASALAACSSGG